MGPARPDIAKELRYHPVGNYLLLYRVIPNGIELVRVVHGARGRNAARKGPGGGAKFRPGRVRTQASLCHGSAHG
jgi:hypothetical protein